MPTEPDLIQTLRPATSGDAPAVARLFGLVRRAAVPHMPPAVHTSEEDQRYFAALLAGDSGDPQPPAEHQADLGTETWVVEAPEELIAFAVLQRDWLHSLYVHPDHAGQGVGTALLDLAKTRRPDGFCLWVFQSNTPARAFYTARGLVSLETTDGRDNEEGVPDLKMAWPGRDPVSFYRGLIDGIDDQLGTLLAQRAALTAAVRRHRRTGTPIGTGTPKHSGTPKPDDSPIVDGEESLRDRLREAEVVSRMAARAPALGPERIARIVHTVIEESVAAADASEGAEPAP